MRDYNTIMQENVPADHDYPTRASFVTYYATTRGVTMTGGDLPDGGFSDHGAASKTGATSVERFFNKDAYTAAMVSYHAAEKKAADAFFAELRLDYPEINDRTFEIVYGYAYEDGHSSGMDNVAECMPDLFEMAKKIILANVKTIIIG